MNKHSLRTKLALKIAPWLKPGEPRAREWKISGRLRSDDAPEVAREHPEMGYVAPETQWRRS